jgi:hypothetical protein
LQPRPGPALARDEEACDKEQGAQGTMHDPELTSGRHAWDYFRRGGSDWIAWTRPSCPCRLPSHNP